MLDIGVLNKFLFYHIDNKSWQEKTAEQEEVIDSSGYLAFSAIEEGAETAVGQLSWFEHDADAT